MKSKSMIRNEILGLRRRTPELVLRQKSGIIAKRILSFAPYLEADTVFAYMPLPGEVETYLIIDDAWRQGKKVAVPRVKGKDLEFVLLHDYDQLSEGAFHVREPQYGLLSECESAFVLLPGVAFDRRGGRIGYGGGFYDRFLTQHPGHYKAALAFGFSIMDGDLAYETHDVSMDAIITERECITLHKEG